MRRSTPLLLGLVVATVIHLDWHMARPAHYHLGGRLGLGWSYHWIISALAFAAIAWFIARRWPGDRWRIGGASLLIGVILGQIVEPMLEVAQGLHRFGYPDEPPRLVAFEQTMLAAIPAYALALWLCGRRAQPVPAGPSVES
jgi:ACR3 family arsenite efflux pump ArsB